MSLADADAAQLLLRAVAGVGAAADAALAALDAQGSSSADAVPVADL